MPSYELMVDNAKMLANCYEIGPVTMDIPGIVVGYGIYTSLFGGTTCLTTNNGDTAYMQQHVGPVSSGFTGFNDNIRFPATTIPGELITPVTLVTVSKGTDNRASPTAASAGGVRLYVTSPTYGIQTFNNVFAHGASDWTEIIRDLSVDDDGDPYAISKDMLEAGTVKYNPGSTLWNCGMSASWALPREFTSKWTYIALRFTYMPDEA